MKTNPTTTPPVTPEPAKGSGGESGLLSCSATLLKAAMTVLKEGRANTSLLQRRHRWGYLKAAHALDDFHGMGMVGPQDEAGPRSVDLKKIEKYIQQNVLGKPRPTVRLTGLHFENTSPPFPKHPRQTL